MSWALNNWRLLAGISAGVAVIAAVWWIDGRGYERGRDAAATITEKQDRSATDAATQASLTRRDCIDTGGVWDVATGKCGRR